MDGKNSGEGVLTVLPEDGGKRFDVYMGEKSGLSRSSAVRLIEDGDAAVNGEKSPKNRRLASGDVITFSIPAPEPDVAGPEDIPIDIVYEDKDVVVVNKPAGMVVHPAAGNRTGTLVNALLSHCGASLSGVGGVARPGIVHRIDKDTSGLLVVAKNDAAHLYLSAQLKGHNISRVYYAIVVGNPKEDMGVIDAPIGRSPSDRKKMAVITDDIHKKRDAVTHYRVLERFSGFAFIEARLETGRTHQIRVHMAHIGHPLLGDVLYGGGHTKFEQRNGALLHGQCLHAGELSFRHPATGETVVFKAPLPSDFERLLHLLREAERE